MPMLTSGNTTRTACARLGDVTGVTKWAYRNNTFSAMNLSTHLFGTASEALTNANLEFAGSNPAPGKGRLEVPGTELEKILALASKFQQITP